MLSIFTFSILSYKFFAWINSWLKNLVESRILRFDSMNRFCQRKIDPTPNPDSDYLGARRPHHLVARARGRPRHPMVRLPAGPPPSLLWTLSRVGKNRNFGFCFVQFREYFLYSFSKTQNSRKQGTGTVASR
jgi:hypothetical protein